MTDRIVIQRRPPKSGAAAGILSAIIPGIGQIYLGQYVKGALFLAIFAGLVTMQPHSGQPFQALMLAGFYIFQIIEAVGSAKEVNRLAIGEDGGPGAAAPLAAPPAAPAKSGSVFWGIVLMALGGIFLLGNFEIIDYDRIFDFWPVIVIVIGLKMIADYFTKKSA